MHLTDGTGNAFTLQIAGYQFPGFDWHEDKWDANWLLIEGHATREGRSWTFLDPCLLTFEVDWLAAWLESVAAGEHPGTIFHTEPNLSFEEIHSGCGIRVHLSHEARPEWTQSKFEGEFYIDIAVAEADVLQAASSLRTQLANYPTRGPTPTVDRHHWQRLDVHSE